jgi:hypothetical protein
VGGRGSSRRERGAGTGEAGERGVIGRGRWGIPLGRKGESGPPEKGKMEIHVSNPLVINGSKIKSLGSGENRP